MTSTAKKIVSDILGTGRTNINNNNYNNYNNNNNDNNFNVCLIETIQESMSHAPSGPSGLASLPASQISGKSLVSGVGSPGEEILPRNWRNFKIDIFDNSADKDHSKLKVSLGIVRQDGTTLNLRASMNSPKRHVFRNVDPLDRHNAHWSLVEEIQEGFKESGIDYKCSKFGLPNKKGGTEIVGFLAESETQWMVIVVMEGRQFDYWIDKSGTTTLAQRKGNIIASKNIGKPRQQLATLKELGL